MIGRRQADAYVRLSGVPVVSPAQLPRMYSFGGTITPGVGTIDMRVPIAQQLYVPLRVDVVDIDIPFLLGLSTLYATGVYVNNVDNKLKCDMRGISTPLVRMDNHMYLEWTEEAHYTTGELDRLHQHFNHPQPELLAALLRR